MPRPRVGHSPGWSVKGAHYLRDHARARRRPQRLGHRLVKHSGRHALRSHLAEIGIHLEGPELDEVFRRFKETADRKKEVTTADLEALVGEELRQREDTYSLVVRNSDGTMLVHAASGVLAGGGNIQVHSGK